VTLVCVVFGHYNFRHDSVFPAKTLLRVGREIPLGGNQAFASTHCLKFQ